MKYILSCVLSLLITQIGIAQNMVSNGSFESYTTCPVSGGQVSVATGWYQYTGGSSDYFNPCSINGTISVPNNNFGYQPAADGNAYVGFYTWAGAGYNYKEYVATAISPMQIGVEYEVSISVSLCNRSLAGTDDIGVYLFKNAPVTVTPLTCLPVSPQVSYAGYGPILDTLNWVRLSKSFVADSAYDHLVIGGFTNVNNITLYGGPTVHVYYYLDSVVVRPARKIRFDYRDTMLCTNDTFSVPYTFDASLHPLTGNQFRVQLSDAAGSFASPTVIGNVTSTVSGKIFCTIPASTPVGTGYLLRVVSTSPVANAYSDMKPISIGSFASKPLSGSNTPACAGSSLNLFASTTSHPALTWKWTGPDGFISTQQNPTISNVTSAKAGDYIVTVSMYGCRAKDTTSVAVTALPAAIIATSNTAICTNDTLKLFSTASSAGAVYNWSGPNSFIANTQNTDISAATTTASGDYIVKATLNGCSVKDTVTVLIKPTPIVNASNNSPVCEGAVLNLMSTANPAGSSIAWTGPNSFSASITNPSIINAVAAATGDYVVSVMLNGCVGKDTTAVIVRPAPLTPVVSSNSPVCVGMALNLTASSGAGATYSWVGPNGFSSTLQNPGNSNAGLIDAGVYSVVATLDGCISSAGVATVVVNPTPFVTIFPTPADTLCQGSTVTFVSIPANAGANPVYKWTRNSSTIVLSTSGTSISNAINNNDVIRCEMTDLSKCGVPYTDVSNEIKMTVLPWLAPSVSIASDPATPLSPGQLIKFTAIAVNGGNKPTYQWKRNNSDLIGAMSSVWSTQQLDNNDSIYVVMTSNYKCPQPTNAATSNKIKITILTDVEAISVAGSMRLYPNPNDGIFSVKGKINNGKEITLQIINTSGQLVYESKVTPDENNELNTQVNVQHMAAGTYILSIKGEKNAGIRFNISK